MLLRIEFGQETYRLNNHVLGIERHKYGQKMTDEILCVEEVRNALAEFIKI
jgi:hypothetical protein